MSNTTLPDAAVSPTTRPRISLLGQFIKPFTDLAGSPRAIWYVIGAFVIDCTAYFGVLTLMTGRPFTFGTNVAGNSASSQSNFRAGNSGWMVSMS